MQIPAEIPLHWLQYVSKCHATWTLNVPPGPPGFRKICLSPVADAFLASILMIGIEKALSDGWLK